MSLDEADQRRVLAVIQRRRGADFHDSRPRLVEACIGEAYARAGSPPAGAWLDGLEHDDAALDALVRALRVRVTSFFREPETFAMLAEKVLPELMAHQPLQATLRAWVIGCATGEEAWSLATVLREACGPVGYSVFATDSDPTAIVAAREGTYTRSQGLSPTQWTRDFHDRGEPHPALRARVRFAVHRFMGPERAPRDVVLPLFPLVLCRNVIMHFDPRLQAAAWARLAETVAPGGALVVGESEGVAAGLGLEPWPGVPRAIYRRREDR